MPRGRQGSPAVEQLVGGAQDHAGAVVEGVATVDVVEQSDLADRVLDLAVSRCAPRAEGHRVGVGADGRAGRRPSTAATGGRHRRTGTCVDDGRSVLLCGSGPGSSPAAPPRLTAACARESQHPPEEGTREHVVEDPFVGGSRAFTCQAPSLFIRRVAGDVFSISRRGFLPRRRRTRRP